jgi:pimeloyl-ACP methyl ester carboxylesterase
MKKYIILIVIVILLLPLAIIFLRPTRILTKHEAEEKYKLETSHFLNWRGAKLHYTDEGSGPPLMMIHGYGGSHRNFDKIKELLKDDFRVIRVDLPGFGLSDFPKLEDEKSADLILLYRDYFTFILNELNLDSVYLMGNSMGGTMACGAALNNPEKVRKLILMCSAGYEMEKVSEKAASLMKKSFVEKMFMKGMPLFMSQDGAEMCWYDDSKINSADVVINNDFWNREGNIHAAFLIAGSAQYPDTTEVKKITCPTLIVWGKEDEIIPYYHAEKFHRDIPNSSVIMYEKCGHVPMIENPIQLEKDVLAFLK